MDEIKQCSSHKNYLFQQLLNYVAHCRDSSTSIVSSIVSSVMTKLVSSLMTKLNEAGVVAHCSLLKLYAPTYFSNNHKRLSMPAIQQTKATSQLVYLPSRVNTVRLGDSRARA